MVLLVGNKTEQKGSPQCPTPAWPITHVPLLLAFYMCAGNPKSGLYAYMANILLTKPSPQPNAMNFDQLK